MSNNNKLIKVFIGKTFYQINCEYGTQDISWLALTACYLHGKKNYPEARYIPIYAVNKNKEMLHPRMILYKYEKKIGDEVYLTIQQSSIEGKNVLFEKEKDWYNKAFGKEKYLMDLKIRFYPSIPDFKYNIKVFYAKIKFEIMESIAHFPEYRTDEIIDIALPFSAKTNDIHENNLKLPYGLVTLLKIYYKETEDSIKEIYY